MSTPSLLCDISTCVCLGYLRFHKYDFFSHVHIDTLTFYLFIFIYYEKHYEITYFIMTFLLQWNYVE